MQEFHLTMAEACTVAGLASGSTVEQIAAARGTKPGTIYLHVKRALAKTSTTTQAKLVSLVLHGVTASVKGP